MLRLGLKRKRRATYLEASMSTLLLSDAPLLPRGISGNSGTPLPNRCSVIFEKLAARTPAAGFVRVAFRP